MNRQLKFIPRPQFKRHFPLVQCRANKATWGNQCSYAGICKAMLSDPDPRDFWLVYVHGEEVECARDFVTDSIPAKVRLLRAEMVRSLYTQFEESGDLREGTLGRM